ncbi:MAG TPA: LacI family DNA-binding transcriptional regulator, partial [Thermoanaerobaculia bacterium]|nr:LacI family DNA-binding transcriptional regulator [Thermoanaerobaculia bacterium]
MRAHPAGLPLTGPTIKDVAARAGVSVATVSRVLNEKALVREETVKRVLDAAKEMQYVPHGGARSLSMRQTSTVGVVLPDLHGEFFSEVIRGIDIAARRRGFHLLVSGSHSDWSEMAAMALAVRGRVDGLIVMVPDMEPDAVQARLPGGVPIVLLNCRSTTTWSIVIDNAAGAEAMVVHLAGLGHRDIAFIAGPEANADAAERLRGWRVGMERIGSEARPALLAKGDFSENGGYEAAYSLLSGERRPTAIFAANDAMAIGALSALREQGYDVPGKIAVAGFDDIPIARFVSPPLTTVSVEIAELGRRAFELFLEGTEAGSIPRLETLET